MTKVNKEAIIETIADQLGVDPTTVTDDANFIEDLGADSLDTVELVMALEEDLGFEIPDDDSVELVTLGKIMSYIEEKNK